MFFIGFSVPAVFFLSTLMLWRIKVKLMSRIKLTMLANPPIFLSSNTLDAETIKMMNDVE